MKNTTKIKQKLCAEKILDYLHSNLDIAKGYPSKTSWGYAMTYLAGKVSKTLTGDELAEKSLKFLLMQNTKDKNYPWEFIVFALKETDLIRSQKIRHEGTNLKKKGTTVLNWRLLHIYNKIQFKKFNILDEIFLRLLIKIHQKPYGLLMDEYLTRSLQYHNFSVLILLKIFEKNKKLRWLEEKIIIAIDFSLSNIMSDGTSQFIGRGQEQIFGYASLIAALKIFENIFNKDLDKEINLLVNKVYYHQREDGFIPLVLRTENLENSIQYYSENETPSGWYSYNSSFDYLPFLSYCLLLKI